MEEKVYRYTRGDDGQLRVCVKIANHMRPFPGGFWSKSAASFVLVRPDVPDNRTWAEGVDLVSVNSIGEIRWHVYPNRNGPYQPQDQEAIDYFGLRK